MISLSARAGIEDCAASTEQQCPGGGRQLLKDGLITVWYLEAKFSQYTPVEQALRK